MDFTTIINSTASPLLITILLALVFAIDPCAILTNIAAIGFVSRDIDNHKRVFISGLWYTLGRTLAFGVLGGLLMWLLQSGTDILHIQDFFSEWGELLLVPFFLLMGVLMLVADFLPSIGGNSLSDKVQRRLSRNSSGAFLLGAVLSLAFCPTNAALFFGMVAQPHITFWHVLIFAVVVALPVLLVAWILAFSYDNISRFYNRIRNVGRWFRIVVGIVFVLLGLFFAVEHLLE